MFACCVIHSAFIITINITPERPGTYPEGGKAAKLSRIRCRGSARDNGRPLGFWHDETCCKNTADP